MKEGFTSISYSPSKDYATINDNIYIRREKFIAELIEHCNNRMTPQTKDAYNEMIKHLKSFS